LAYKDSTNVKEVITQSKLALMFGISTSRIRQLDKEEAFVKVGRGKYDLAQSIQSYIAYQVEKKSASEDDDLNKLKEETLWTRSRRKKSELEYKIMTGELHRSEDVEAVMNSMLASFRSQLLAFPTKAAAKITGMTEIMQVQEALKKEIYELMQELSDYDPDEFYKRSRDKIFVDEDAEAKDIEKD
jgi:phage terminase Nu1 subunit (DNA packaging protein)